MNKIWIIIQREYITRVRRKSFLITTLLAPLGFFLLISASVLISTYSQSRTDVAVVDESGLFRDVTLADADDKTVYFHKVDEKYDDIIQSLPTEKNKQKKFNAIIFIPAHFNIQSPNNPSIAYRYVERPGAMKRQFINSQMNKAINKVRLQHLKADNELIEKMQENVKLNYESLGDDKEKTGFTDAAAVVGLIMGFAIYISIFFYGTMIMKGVMEEKTSRVVEVLTSSVKPFQLLMGKIIGIGAVGLTQFVLWILLIFGVNLLAGIIFGVSIGHQSPAMSGMDTQGVDVDDIELLMRNLSSLPFGQIAILFPIYFIGGFLLYGALFAAIGAAMGEDGDQQSLMVPVTIPIIISIFIAINVINDPDSNLGFWGSVIPFTSPVVMSALLPFSPDWWQIALSVMLLIAGFIFTTYLAARVYRTAILMYGKKITLKEMGRWIFARN